MTTATQPTLFETRVERGFREWIETPDGRRVEAEIVARAKRLLERGWRHYGVKALFESIRYDASVGLLGDGPYLLNNNHASLLARRIMRQHPDLDGFFEVRALHGRWA